jgi:hypothetical protein
MIPLIKPVRPSQFEIQGCLPGPVGTSPTKKLLEVMLSTFASPKTVSPSKLRAAYI